MEVSATETRSIISLLSDISSSLAAINDQQAALQDSIARANRHCNHECQLSLNARKAAKEKFVCECADTEATTQDLPPQGRDESFPNLDLDAVSDDVQAQDLVDLIAIPYEAYTPSEELVLDKFDVCYKDILGYSEIQDRLSCLPPDDSRLSIHATRGAFLRQLISDANPWNNPANANKGDRREVLRDLLQFEDFKAKIEPGQVWIRDYDSYGCYTQWDCVGLPKVSSSTVSKKTAQCRIPDSEWPLNWRHQQSRPVAPWRRIISCRGLSQMIDNQGPIYNPYFGRTLDQAALAVHLSQQGRGQLGRKSTDFRLDMHNKRGCFFQITYAKPSTSSIEDIAPSAWPSGSLYPGGWHRSMEYQSITIDAVSDQSKDSEHDAQRKTDNYWTILFMEPISWYDDLENTLQKAITEDSSMQVAFLVLVGYALHCAIVEWQRMALYFDTLLSPNSIHDHESALLSPDKHDRLLFEDESFSRSRKYFWVIDALTRFIQEIEETQDVWERYRVEEVESALKQLTGNSYDMLAQNLLKAEDEVSKLYSARQRLERHLERTKVLRDGLFNASAVIESRASTELGQNVRLLTFVSIFYLPLSFCTSLWSVQSTFSFTNLAIVMVTVAVATYIAVFNLERLVRNGHGLYAGYRRGVVSHMQADLGWEDRAKRFGRFEPDRRSNKPTNWYVLWASMLIMGQWWRRVVWTSGVARLARMVKSLSTGFSKRGRR